MLLGKFHIAGAERSWVKYLIGLGPLAFSEALRKQAGKQIFWLNQFPVDHGDNRGKMFRSTHSSLSISNLSVLRLAYRRARARAHQQPNQLKLERVERSILPLLSQCDQLFSQFCQ